MSKYKKVTEEEVMIIANELRIGNFVEANGVYGGSVRTFERFNDDLSVVFFSDGSEHGIGEFLSDCDPIPLTEEWLIKFGFSDKDYKEGYTGIDVKNFDFPLCKPKVLGEFQECFAFQYKIGGLPLFRQIEFVHELQNLFYALFGEELTINQK